MKTILVGDVSLTIQDVHKEADRVSKVVLGDTPKPCTQLPPKNETADPAVILLPAGRFLILLDPTLLLKTDRGSIVWLALLGHVVGGEVAHTVAMVASVWQYSLYSAKVDVIFDISDNYGIYGI